LNYLFGDGINFGELTALTDACGASKRTLLKTLTQGKNFGIVTCGLLVDGKLLGAEFRRETGSWDYVDI